MVNRSKAIGTGYENKVLERLRSVYGPYVERSAAGTPGRDFVGTWFPCEAKKRKEPSWRIPTWAKYLRELHGNRWVLFVSPGDLRRTTSPPELMIVPVELGIELLRAHYKLPLTEEGV